MQLLPSAFFFLDRHTVLMSLPPPAQDLNLRCVVLSRMIYVEPSRY